MSASSNPPASARGLDPPGVAGFGDQSVPGPPEPTQPSEQAPGVTPESPVFPDADLLARLRAGDDPAFEELVRTLSPQLLAVARTVTRSEADAEDVVQDAFISAFKAVHAFDGRSTLRTWLHRIVVNAALSRNRKSSSRRESSIDALLPTFQSGRHAESPSPWRAVTPGRALGVEQARAVHAALDSLPEEFRAVLVLKDVVGMQSSAIAEALGISDALVRQRVHRGRQALMKLLAPVMQEASL